MKEASAVGALCLAAICLAAAAACLEPTARQERGWFGAFIGAALFGLILCGIALHLLGVTA